MPGGRQGTPGFDPDRLRAARRAAHLTQAELAAAAGAHFKEVREWESGRRVPQVNALAALAGALGLKTVDLIRLPAEQDITLQYLRVAAGLSQQAVADRAGLQRTTYSKVERGEAVALSDDDAAAIARALGVQPEQVLDAHTASRASYQERRDSATGRKKPGIPQG